ncbi:hypothetical protein PV10_08183 [Exophiala mesophila]|uniref:AB hydrolase-1 domain-containing protein n=1 Tax=Exophiala mesophila TaxID=212818 RepID=A0A0D1XK05_EXOME|nr:uncharacterized protein PV10_08183 [Exophiala mesophila]KIV88501.1 hypothetical protein PV10_08183 [Exophiala mesophila]
MLQLSTNAHFHFELLRVLATTRSYGADIAEVLRVCQRIKPGDFESWYEEFRRLAEWVESTVNAKGEHDKVTLRDAYFRISRYYFASSFFLDGNQSDARLVESYNLWKSYFDKATSLLAIPAERHILDAGDFQIPVILLRASLDNRARSCLIMGSGLDGSAEEMLHFHGFAALERGHHVILYEGPGQTSVRRDQGLGFIHDWERVVTPIVDWLQNVPFVDSSKCGLFGVSLGGYLAARAAAFEHRLAAVILNDAIYDFSDVLEQMLGESTMRFEAAGDMDNFYAAVEQQCQSNTKLRWLAHQLRYAFAKETIHEALRETRKMTVSGILNSVQCPVFVGDAEHDLFVRSEQPPLVAQGLGKWATYKKFTKAEAAEAHCHLGATVFANQVMLEWFGNQVGAVESQGTSLK